MRFASASFACIVASACVTPPPPLPPRRTVFPPVAAPVQRPPDLAQPAEPPLRHERYIQYTLPIDLISVIPLTYWIARPDDVYLAAPALVLTPLVHFAMGEPNKGILSLFLRGAMVGAVYLAGRQIEQECSDEFICVPIGSLLLAELAIVPVIVLDNIFLARRVREEPGWRRLPVIPTVSATPNGGMTLGIGGRF